MIVLDKPYVSSFLEETIRKNEYPVLILSNPEDLQIKKPLNIKNPQDFIGLYNLSDKKPLYTNSENSLRWIMENIPNSDLIALIQTFKDKHRLRELLQPFYPNYQFRKINLDQLKTFDVSSFPKPFVIKPNIGFFSLAVYFVRSNEEWPNVVENIKYDLDQNKNVFPEEVINTSEFIIEEAIEGEEYAVDAYFNQAGRPVILNIYHHYHIDASDTGDRLYYTSKKVIQENFEDVSQVLQNIYDVTHAKQFPVHLELRLDQHNRFGVIEANPLRFAGFCVGDLAWFAHQINPYEYFLTQTEPDWKEILQAKDNKRHAFVLGDFPKDIHIQDVKAIDYDVFKQKFAHPLEIREINYNEYPLFSIAFIELPGESFVEMNAIMKDDFRDVIQLKNA